MTNIFKNIGLTYYITICANMYCNFFVSAVLKMYKE